MKPIKTFQSKTVVLPVDNIDTDQIIPARFLKVTDREGLGKACFADWDDRPPQAGAILVAGANFGCGSSREHAVWALMDYGYQAVVSTSIADIFRNNALKNGLLPIVVEASYHKELTADPGRELKIDLETEMIDGHPFSIDSFSRYRLLRGMDELDVLRDALSDIEEFERRRGDDRGAVKA